MKKLIATIAVFAIMACSPESILTPDDCKVELVRKETTFTIGDTLSRVSSYRVTMADGKVLYITEAEALAAQADPVAACQELRGRE